MDKNTISLESDPLLESKADKESSLIVLDPLAQYMIEVRKYPILTSEEEFKLAVKYKEEGDQDAVYTLITSNLYLVVKIVMSFRYAFQNMMDLIQEGNIGLMQAIKRFDPYRGIRLSTYASWWIRAYVLKHLLDNWRLVRVGTTNIRRRLLYNLQKEKERLEAEGFTPGPKLLAERLKAEEKDVIDIEMSLGRSDYSLDKNVGDSKKTYMALLPDTRVKPDEAVEHEQYIEVLKDKINAFKHKLNEKEVVILENRIIAETPMTLQEIGNRYGITKEAVRKAEARLLKRLKEYLSTNMQIEKDMFSG